MAVKVGDKAPDFALFDTDRKKRTLQEFLGKTTLLAFFPGAFTGVCTKELCSLRDSLSVLGSLGAQIVAISVDSPFANKGFSDQYGFGFPLLSDFSREVCSQYTGLQVDFAGLPGYNTSKRAVFILDPKGVVRYTWVSENPGVEPNYEEIKNALRS